jgi:membrane protease YdiL (CAAX protease family)
MIKSGIPAGMAILLGFLFIGIPFEIGVLLYKGKQLNGKLTLKGVIQYRSKMSFPNYAVLFVVLMILAFTFLFLLTPVKDFLSERVFSWLPGFMKPDYEQVSPAPARTAVLVVIILGLLVDGFLNPVVEELYFRGYLLPGISRFKWLSPLFNATLFTLAHFWQPYNYLLIFLIELPLVYAVYWKKNIYIAILAHCTGNIIGAVITLVSFLASV